MDDTLWLDRGAIAALASPADWLAAAEAAFRGLGDGSIRAAAVAHVAGIDGGFHIKSAVGDAPPRAAIKVNGNFPGNPARGLPTIQGCLLLTDAADGRLLALLDSGELTARRTAACSVLAARSLAPRHAHTLAFIGAGVQAVRHLESFVALPGTDYARVRCFDVDAAAARRLATAAIALGLEAVSVDSARAACAGAGIVVTCTPSKRALLDVGDVAAGCFVAAVGADHGDKQELTPALLAHAVVVTDLTSQAAAMGDLHHALAAGVMHPSQVRAELADVVSGRIAGRRDDDEIIVFDSTGVAATDLTAASMLYDRGCGTEGASQSMQPAVAGPQRTGWPSASRRTTSP